MSLYPLLSRARKSVTAACLSASLVPALGLATACLLGAAGAGCVENSTPKVVRPEEADQWFKRAQDDFSSARVDDAHDAINKALNKVPNDAEVRTLGATIALARLEYDESLRLLRDLPGSEAHGLRGRAAWYQGDLPLAAEEFESFLNDPKVRDPWAKQIATLARRGEGRTPYAVSGGIVAAVDMAHVSMNAPYFVVPLEIDGQEGLAMVQTGEAEVVIDAPGKTDPSWVSLRFAHRLEVSDVPALARDLSGVSKDLGVPIKALIGMSLLRHLNVTLDYRGRQFVARAYAPPPPPNATHVPLFYVRGGGMFLSTALGSDDSSRASFLVDSSMRFPLALDEDGWKKAGLALGDLKPLPSDPDNKLKEGVVPNMKLGAFDVSHVPGVLGWPMAKQKDVQFDVDGVIGSALLAVYRITFSDGGRGMWIEDDTLMHEIEDLQLGPMDEGEPDGVPVGMPPINTTEPPIGLPGGPGLPGGSVIPGSKPVVPPTP